MSFSVGSTSVLMYDPMRLTVYVSGLPGGSGSSSSTGSTGSCSRGMRGFMAAAALEAGPYQVVPELATQHTVVLAMGPGTRMHHAEALVAAFRELAASAAVAGPHHEVPELVASVTKAAATCLASDCTSAGSSEAGHTEARIAPTAEAATSTASQSYGDLGGRRNSTTSCQSSLSPRDAFFSPTTRCAGSCLLHAYPNHVDWVHETRPCAS